MKVADLQVKTHLLFREFFGRTPLTARLDDILSEAMELHRMTDFANLREEAGDLGASLLALCEECGFSFEDAVQASHAKIQRRAAQYKTLGRKTKVAILGGAFDPIHQGHVAVAQFVLDSSKTFDEVWLVPCWRHMFNKEMTDAKHRVEMCRLAVENDKRIRVSTYEIDNQLRGETYHFVQRLLAEKFAQDEYDFSLIIGMDNANNFDRWVNFMELERMIRFVVVPREGEVPDPKVGWYLRPPHIFLRADHGILPEVSSTDIRKMIKEYKNIPETMLDPKVVKYIYEHKLY